MTKGAGASAIGKKTIVVVSPLNPVGGGSGLEERIRVLTEGLATRHRVILVFPRTEVEDRKSRLEMSQVRMIEYGRLSGLSRLFDTPPLHPLRFLEASGLSRAIDLLTALKLSQPELVIVEFPYGFFIPKLYCLAHRVPIILSEQNVENLLIRRSGGRLAGVLSMLETLAVKLSDCTICTSENDRELLSSMAEGKRIEVVKNGVFTSEFAPLPNDGRVGMRRRFGLSRGRLGIFHGSMDYPPNAAAAEWLDQKIVPRVRDCLNDFEMIVAGRHGDRLQLPNSRYMGFVPRLNELLQCCDVALVPLTVGSGTKIKVLQYLSSGVPTVLTGIAGEGLNLTHRSEVLFSPADDDSFARAVIEILTDSTLSRTLSENGRKFVKERYDWSLQIDRFAELAEQVGGGKD